MKTPPIFINFVLIVLLSSCARVMTVKEGEKRVAGIPFYAHKQVIEQQTKYLYTWEEVTLIRKTGGEKLEITPIIQKRIVSGQDLSSLEMKVENLNDPKKTERDISNVIAEIKKLSMVTLESTSISSTNVISNSWETKLVVDYATKYYINSKLPWLGSSTVTQKLAANGTLSEATANVDSQIDEIATAVAGVATPISSVKIAKIESEIDLSAEQELSTIELFGEVDPEIVDKQKLNFADMLNELKNSKVTYELKVEEKGYVYTFSCIHEDSQDGTNEANTPIAFDLTSGNFTRTNWPLTNNSATKEDKPTINVSGSIQLPEEKKEQ